jgi:hypothetical protein
VHVHVLTAVHAWPLGQAGVQVGLHIPASHVSPVAQQFWPHFVLPPVQEQTLAAVHICPLGHCGSQLGGGSTHVLFGPQVWLVRQQFGPHSWGRSDGLHWQPSLRVHV